MSDIDDELGDETSGLTRRQVIKRVGIGAAVAWAAPAITTLGARAYAASPRCSGNDWSCGQGLELCGEDCYGPCVCDLDTERNSVCWQNRPCDQDLPCTTSADCPAGTVCVPNTCCSQPVCLPACGDCNGGAQQAEGPTPSGR